VKKITIKKKNSEFYYYLAVVLYICFLAVNSLVAKPIFSKYQLLVVSSGSMEPSLPQSALILIQTNLEYKINDIITFTQEDTTETITHRIIDEKSISNTRHYLTKGDKNQATDGWIQESKILGKVIWSGFILLGSLIYLQSNDFLAQLIIIWLPLLTISAIELKKIYKELSSTVNRS
jgi:signal peptidase